MNLCELLAVFISYLRLYFPAVMEDAKLVSSAQKAAVVYCSCLVRQCYGQFGATFLSLISNVIFGPVIIIIMHKDNSLRKCCAVVTLVFTLCKSC